MQPTTLAHLNSLLQLINTELNEECYIDMAYGGYRLYNNGSNVLETGYVSKRILYECMLSYYKGLRTRRTLQEENKILREGIESMSILINESSGVVGLHLNGDVASWDSLLAGGNYEEWLLNFSIAEELLKESK